MGKGIGWTCCLLAPLYGAFFFFFNLNVSGVGGKVAKETGLSKEPPNLQKWRKRERRNSTALRGQVISKPSRKTCRKLLQRSGGDMVRVGSEAVVAGRSRVR